MVKKLDRQSPLPIRFTVYYVLYAVKSLIHNKLKDSTSTSKLGTDLSVGNGHTGTFSFVTCVLHI